jgi:hypothetical protein
MRILLLAVAVFLSAYAHAQSPRQPIWDKKEILFNCSNMKVKDDNVDKIIFQGARNSSIKFTERSEQMVGTLVDVKLGNYFQCSGGEVTKAEFSIDKDYKSVTYTIYKDIKLCVIIVSYAADADIPSFIIVSTNDNWKGNGKKMTFTLDGFRQSP